MRRNWLLWQALGVLSPVRRSPILRLGSTDLPRYLLRFDSNAFHAGDPWSNTARNVSMNVHHAPERIEGWRSLVLVGIAHWPVLYLHGWAARCEISSSNRGGGRMWRGMEMKPCKAPSIQAYLLNSSHSSHKSTDEWWPKFFHGHGIRSVTRTFTVIIYLLAFGKGWVILIEGASHSNRANKVTKKVLVRSIWTDWPTNIMSLQTLRVRDQGDKTKGQDRGVKRPWKPTSKSLLFGCLFTSIRV